MRKSMLVAAIAAVAFGAGFFAHDAVAQDSAPAAASADAKGGKGEGKGDRRGGGLFQAALKVNGLTDEQKQKIEAAQKEQQEKMKEIREASKDATDDAAKKASREKMMELNKEARQKIEGILTEDQKKEFAANAPQRGNWSGKKDDATTKTN
jgi:Spy/CpxP family protein refolding chaperone